MRKTRPQKASVRVLPEIHHEDRAMPALAAVPACFLCETTESVRLRETGTPGKVWEEGEQWPQFDVWKWECTSCETEWEGYWVLSGATLAGDPPATTS